MDMDCISQCVKQTRVINATVAGTTAINGSIIDMQGFEGISFTALFGTITTGAVTGLKLQQGTKSDGSDMSDVSGTAVSIPDTGSNQALVLDIFKPQKRYVRVVVTRGTANAAVDGVIANQYCPRITPPGNDYTTVAATKYVISPIEGTP